MTFLGALYLIFLVAIFAYTIVEKVKEVKSVHEYKKNRAKIVEQEKSLHAKTQDTTIKKDTNAKDLDRVIDEIFNNNNDSYQLLFNLENKKNEIYSKKATERVIDDLYKKVIVENERDIYNLFLECMTNTNDYDLSNVQTVIASYYKKWFFIEVVAAIYDVSLFENDSWNIERDLKYGVVPSNFSYILTLLATLVVKMGELCYVRANSQLNISQERYDELVNHLRKKIEQLVYPLENRMLFTSEHVIQLEKLIITQISKGKQFDMPDGSSVYMFNLNKQKIDMVKVMSIIFIKSCGREFFNEKFIDERVYDKIVKENISNEKEMMQLFYDEISSLYKVLMIDNNTTLKFTDRDLIVLLPNIFECRQILVMFANICDKELYYHQHLPTEKEIEDILLKEYKKGNLVDYTQLIMSSTFTALQYVLLNCMDYIKDYDDNSYLEMKKALKEMLKYAAKLIALFEYELDIDKTALENSLNYNYFKKTSI